MSRRSEPAGSCRPATRRSSDRARRQSGRRHGSENLPPASERISFGHQNLPASCRCVPCASTMTQKLRLGNAPVRHGRAECGSASSARRRAVALHRLRVCRSIRNSFLVTRICVRASHRDCENRPRPKFLAPVDVGFGRERIVGMDCVAAARARPVIPVEILDPDRPSSWKRSVTSRPVQASRTHLHACCAPARTTSESAGAACSAGANGPQLLHPPTAAGAPAAPASSRRRSTVSVTGSGDGQTIGQ